MRVQDLESHYPKWADAADAIGISRQLMSKIKRANKPIPIEYQIKWEVATQGSLKADVPEQIRRCHDGSMQPS